MSEDKLYRKYDVRRTDGRDQEGQVHEGCSLFVLDYTHDECARAAIQAYADACEEQSPGLAADLREQLSREVDRYGGRPW